VPEEVRTGGISGIGSRSFHSRCRVRHGRWHDANSLITRKKALRVAGQSGVGQKPCFWEIGPGFKDSGPELRSALPHFLTRRLCVLYSGGIRLSIPVCRSNREHQK
jgi:hypothetical protein